MRLASRSMRPDLLPVVTVHGSLGPGCWVWGSDPQVPSAWGTLLSEKAGTIWKGVNIVNPTAPSPLRSGWGQKPGSWGEARGRCWTAAGCGSGCRNPMGSGAGVGALPHGHGHPRAQRCSVSQAQPAKPQLLEFWGSVTPWGESQQPPLTSGRAPRVFDRDAGKSLRAVQGCRA